MIKNTHLQPPQRFLDLMRKRGYREEEGIREFLFPSLSTLRPPDKMKNLLEASEIASFYIGSGLQIVVWGDYDVDGTTGTSLLLNFFHHLGVDVIWHIPNRLTEGYGLNTEWFKQNIRHFQSKKFLLITVDCGISNKDAVDEIQAMGGEVIVTDHHAIPSGGIPGCLVLNPEQPDCGFHDTKLAGVAVAFYLAAGIKKCLQQKNTAIQSHKNLNLKQYLAFVAIGTIADMVELTPTNRLLVKAGFEALAETPFTGLSMLLESCELHGQQLCSDDIGYLLGPKINAAGRLGKSRAVVELFTEKDHSVIKSKIKYLNRLNNERKELCDDNLEQALMQIDEGRVREHKCCIVFGDYHLGIAGIVASRLVELFGVPAIVMAESIGPDGDTVYKGSGRSVDGVNLVEVLENCAGILLKFGGHEMAAGLSCISSDIKNCVNILEKELYQKMISKKTKRKLPFDIECNIDEVMDSGMLHYLSLMEPYGPGNLQPVFKDNQAKFINSRTVGKDAAHLSVVLRGNYSNHKGIGFNLGKKISEIQEIPIRTLLYSPTKNRFRGTVSWQVRILDV